LAPEEAQEYQQAGFDACLIGHLSAHALGRILQQFLDHPDASPRASTDGAAGQGAA
jgi:hypothetical protein